MQINQSRVITPATSFIRLSHSGWLLTCPNCPRASLKQLRAALHHRAHSKPVYPASPVSFHGNHSKISYPHFPLPLPPGWPWCLSVCHCEAWHAPLLLETLSNKLSFQWKLSSDLLVLSCLLIHYIWKHKVPWCRVWARGEVKKKDQ